MSAHAGCVRDGMGTVQCLTCGKGSYYPADFSASWGGGGVALIKKMKRGEGVSVLAVQ
jgi:hypothetical protein